MKKLSVVVAGTGQIRDVEIQPGTTAGDVLHQLNLPDYLLCKGPNEPFFAAAESVYDKVKDGEKIFASTKAEVGVARMRVRDLGTRPAPASLRELFSRVVRGHAPSIPVQRRQIPYWQERGWTRQGQHLHRQLPDAATARFRAGSSEQRSGHIDFYLYNPSHGNPQPQPLDLLSASRQRLVPGPHGAASPRMSARESSPSND